MKISSLQDRESGALNLAEIQDPMQAPLDDPVSTHEAMAASPALALWWHLARTYHTLSQRFTPYLEGWGITGAQFGVIRCLGEAGEDGMMLTGLSERLMVSCGNITQVVDRLESGGLLQRERSLEDRRVVIARLTLEGQRLYRTVVPAFRRHIVDVLAVSDDEEKRLLADLCEQLNQSLGTYSERNRDFATRDTEERRP